MPPPNCQNQPLGVHMPELRKTSVTHNGTHAKPRHRLEYNPARQRGLRWEHALSMGRATLLRRLSLATEKAHQLMQIHAAMPVNLNA
jgi:hypothetical protein